MFANQPNIIIDNGTHPTIHSKCHHQLIYVKLNLKIDNTSPYTGEIWNYNSAETDLINPTI